MLIIIGISLYGIIHTLTQPSNNAGIDTANLLELVEICSGNLRDNKIEFFLDKKQD